MKWILFNIHDSGMSVEIFNIKIMVNDKNSNPNTLEIIIYMFVWSIFRSDLEVGCLPKQWFFDAQSYDFLSASQPASKGCPKLALILILSI